MRIVSNIPQKAEAYFKDLEKRIVQATVKTAHTVGIIGEARAKAIIEREAYDTGEGLRSVTHDVRLPPNAVILAVFAAADHMLIMEKGRKPGRWPNLDALTKWVGRKLREQGVNTRVNVSFDQLKALAASSKGKQKDAYRAHLSMLYLVGRKIATKGIKEKLIFQRLQAGLLREFRDTLVNAFHAMT